jgi:phosphatidylinositol alpha-1,6-mannosyltransferase
METVLVTSIYPPMIGGAGAVMHSLATQAPDQIAVVTCEFDQRGNRIYPEGADLHNTIRIPRLSHDLEWLPRGRFRAIAQAAYDRFLFYPHVTGQLIKALDSLQPQVVCVGTLSSCYWVVQVVRSLRPAVKVVVYVHGEEVPQPGGGYHSQLRLAALYSASKLVAVSSYTKGALVNAGISPDKIAVITNGVDVARFSPGKRSPALIERYGLANRRVLMTLARLDERKGQDMLLRALPAIRAAVPDVVYLIVGEGSYEAPLRRLVAELHLEETVIFAGAAKDDEVVDFYRTCDVYAMPNRTTEEGDTEGFGLVFLEAGACAKPVIGGLAGGVPDAIVDQKTGLLVDGTSVESIAGSCILLLNAPGQCEQLGAEGLLHARANQWSTKTQEFLSLCQTVVRS